MEKELLQKISKITTHDTSLDNQILFLEVISQTIKSPLTISILSSLKELKSIKKRELEKIKK